MTFVSSAKLEVALSHTLLTPSPLYRRERCEGSRCTVVEYDMGLISREVWRFQFFLSGTIQLKNQ